MTEVVGCVMRQRAERERILVQIGGLGQKIQYQIAAANVVRQVADEPMAERVIAHILDDCAAIGVSMRLSKIVRARIRKSLQQEGLYIVFPGSVDDRLVRQD